MACVAPGPVRTSKIKKTMSKTGLWAPPSLASFMLILMLMIPAVHGAAPADQAGPASAPRGIPPRPQASAYPASQQKADVAVGAMLLGQESIRQKFSLGLHDEFLVVEIAIYPEPGRAVAVRFDQFTLTVPGTPAPVPAEQPADAAACLYRKEKPERNVRLEQTTVKRYETPSYDPLSGKPTGGDTVTSNVDIKTGETRRYQEKVDAARQELERKALPEVLTAKPVSGFLYFRRPAGAGTAGPFRLEYAGRQEVMVLELKPGR